MFNINSNVIFTPTWLKLCKYGKNSFAEKCKNLARYGSVIILLDKIII